MTKFHIEICMISARDLRHSLSLLKPQCFAVGWIDPSNKYCTKIDSSGSSNPTWKTKFSFAFDDTNANLEGMSLTIEVYRRQPIFLTEKLQGTATILLKEFFAKFAEDTEGMRSGSAETGSFQLRKRGSAKAQGFVDISVRIYEEREGLTFYSGINEDHGYSDRNKEIQLAIEDMPVMAYPTQPQLSALVGVMPKPPPKGDSQKKKKPQLSGSSQFGGYTQTGYPYNHPISHASNYSESSTSGTGYRRPPTPPPPPPPSNAGFLPTLFPATSQLPERCVNLSPTGLSAPSSDPGLGMGLSAGALAAGAVIFGDDFMSGASFPSTSPPL